MAFAFAFTLVGLGIALGRRAPNWEAERIGWLIGASGLITLLAAGVRH